MNDPSNISLPKAVLTAIAEGTHMIRAYREFLGYSIEEMAVACGLTVEEIGNIEAGHKYDRGYRERIARALSLPADTFAAGSEMQDAA
jgi:transcriptional regulator with XRE-family HTH domain